MSPGALDRARLGTVLRYGVVLIAGMLAGNRLLSAVGNWREWHRWAATDPSAADLYRTNFWFDLASVAVAIGLAALLFYLLRPTASTGRRGS